jgi:lysyl-tRNA synthetase class 1
MNEAQPSSLTEVLQRIESRRDSFDISDAHDGVETYAKAHPNRSAEEDRVVKAELVALGLFADHPHESSPWGTHFGPMMVTRRGEYPPLAAVTPEMVAYWKTRAEASAHSRLRARYADAAWDLEPKISGGKRDPQFARIAIDAYVADCGLAGIDVHQIEGLERALYLALKLGDDTRVGTVRDTILAFQEKVAAPDKARLVMFHFDALYDHRKKIKLSGAQLAEMVDGLEKQLAEWSDPVDKGFDPWSARELGQRLVQHYRASDQPDDVKRVVQVYAKAKLHIAGQANGMLSHHWLEELHQDYLDVGMRAEADALVPQIAKAGERMGGEMRRISTSMEVPNDKMEEFCQGITDGSVEAAIERIVDTFAPDAENLRKQMHEQFAQHPLLGMFKVVIADEFTRAQVGGVQDDEAGRLVMHMHQHMAFESLFLHQAIDRMVSRYALTPEQSVELLGRSELFDAARKPLLVAGVRHYVDGDHASCAHVLVPQIEHLLRRLLASLGGITVSLDSETRTYREKDLGTILRDPLMENFWKQAAKRDIALYLRVVLTDQRALNVRNRLCHGLCSADWFTPQITDRLLHILMLLSLVRLEQRETPPPETETSPDKEPT